MLDTFIIDRIRREREREVGQQPLRIERQPPPVPVPDSRRERDVHDEPRGSVTIDFRL